MRDWPYATLTCLALLATRAGVGAPQNAAGPGPADTVWRARVAIAYDPGRRCPDLRRAEEGDEVDAYAVVLFRVGSTGVPSQASLRATSRSETLDAAAVSCVLKLRFHPATRDGDGVAIDSWQQIAWRWARRPAPVENSAGASTTAPAAATLQSAAPIARAPQGTQPAGAAEVRACADADGRLVQQPAVIHSSGDSHLDEAAARMAASGAGQNSSGCVRITVRFESN